jgi:carboxyl-terminal processing protease
MGQTQRPRSVRVATKLFLICSAWCVACADDDELRATSPEPAPTTLAGTWISPGWNLALVGKEGVLEAYELTSSSCLPYATLAYDGLDIPELGGIGHFEQGELLVDLFGTAQIRALRADALPSTCDGGGTPMSDDPEVAFDVFFRTFDEMYSSFDLRGVDWSAQYDAQRSQVTAETTPAELFGVLCEMVAPLDDPHVIVAAGEATCDSKPPPAWVESEMLDQVIGSIESRIYGEGATLTGNELVAYRTLQNRVGYVFVPSMGGFAEAPAEDVELSGRAMDEVVAAFRDLDGVIVDVRFNGGGSDAISLALASRFADQRRLAFAFETRDGDGWTPRRNYYVERGGPAQFTKPVVVLTSKLSVSAAETFTLAMRALPHVTVVGETTSGGLSNMMLRNLPNGFGFSLPFERVFAPDGTVYEGIGLAPDVAQAFDPVAFVGGEDTMLDAAVAKLVGSR